MVQNTLFAYPLPNDALCVALFFLFIFFFWRMIFFSRQRCIFAVRSALYLLGER